ncbi:MAG: inositol monophosphatase family protein [Patescibacteria group bacterium]
MNEWIDLEKFTEKSIEAALTSFKIIRPFAQGVIDLGDVTTKKDDTLFTIADKKSDEAGKNIIREAFPDITFWGEEIGLTQKNSRFEYWRDPLDGSAPFAVGAPTSTIIDAIYDKILKKLVAATIAEPAYLRVWTAIKGKGCLLHVFEEQPNGEFVEIFVSPRKVWEGKIARGTAVFSDFTQGFKRDKGTRQILNDAQALKLTTILAKNYRLLLMGSNGAHHAYVAEGRDKVVGGFTTAMGGQWDVPGALVINEAGGSCLGFRISSSKELIPEDPLDPMAYDILVYANSDETLNILCDHLREAIAG